MTSHLKIHSLGPEKRIDLKTHNFFDVARSFVYVWFHYLCVGVDTVRFSYISAIGIGILNLLIKYLLTNLKNF